MSTRDFRSDVATYPPEFTGLIRVRDVPEPGTLALIAGTLLTAGVLRTRRGSRRRPH